jgi:hypothetical protein
MKKQLLRIAFVLLFPTTLAAQCGVIFQGNYISSENCSITGGQFLYNINVTVTSPSTLNIYGLWAESTNITANLVCNSDSFTIPQQTVSGVTYRGGGRLNGILVHIHYFAHLANDPDDECDLYYQPVVQFDPAVVAKSVAYPNPFSERLTLETEINGETVNFVMFDVNGKQVLTSLVSSPSEIIETGHLQAGVYFYHFNGAGNVSQKGMILKK